MHHYYWLKDRHFTRAAAACRWQGIAAGTAGSGHSRIAADSAASQSRKPLRARAIERVAAAGLRPARWAKSGFKGVRGRRFSEPLPNAIDLCGLLPAVSAPAAATGTARNANGRGAGRARDRRR
ncbi:hypothetical protein [Lysobacter gummosus]|uniref:hypothetical protein n=1 Tax=Lysobacter gummosus TaxID=262324 RepID=UPI003632C4A1